MFKAINYLQTQVKGRSPVTSQELLNYLEKLALEIIGDRCRQQIGKEIGSSRVENGVDFVV